jgi:hypothetical protein
MNAPPMPPQSDSRLSHAARLKVHTILAMMQRGMRYEDAYASLMAKQPAQPSLPLDHSRNGKQPLTQHRVYVLAKAIEANPGSTKRQLQTITGITDWQFQRAVERLALEGRLRREKSRLNVGFYYPVFPATDAKVTSTGTQTAENQ